MGEFSLWYYMFQVPTGAFVCPRSQNTCRVKGFKFRDWFGVSWFHCTFKHISHSTFRVLNLGIGLGFHGSTAPETTYYHGTFRVLKFRDWFGVSWFLCSWEHILHATRGVLNWGIDLGVHVCTAPCKARSRPRLRFFLGGIGLGFLRSLPKKYRSWGKRRSLAVQVQYIPDFKITAKRLAVPREGMSTIFNRMMTCRLIFSPPWPC